VTDRVAPPRRARRIASWSAIAAALVLVGIVGALLAGAGEWSDAGVLDPDSAGPDGARAVAGVLREQGIEVHEARSRDDALAALGALGGDATLVLPDASVLTDAEIEQLAGAAGGTVLVEPRARTLRLLLPGSAPAATADASPLSPACDVDAARGDILSDAMFTAGDGVIGCYPADDAYALLVNDAGTVAAIDGRSILANDSIGREGNAALALTLLGERDDVVWYVPSPGDASAVGAPTLGELTPGWVTPVIVLLIAAAVAAGVWRGRRFGPLVAENLPVTVRATETSDGRARLYARSRDAAHAYDQVRAGALTRLGRLLALAPRSDAGTIADAVAQRLGADRGGVRALLVDGAPRDDRELVDLSDRLRELEARVRASIRPEGNTP
jgi:hypothetical protein